MAAVLVIARLCEPSSELQIAEHWYRRSALEDLLGLPSDRVNDDRLYRTLDRLLMSSADNIAWLQETGRRYLIGAPKSELQKWSREIADEQDWKTVRDGVEAKVCRGPDGGETFLLCRSADRREKERAMHERFSKRIEERLVSLGRRLERSRKPLDRETIGRQIGRMLAQNSRAAGRYQIGLLSRIRAVEDTRAMAAQSRAGQ